MVETLVGLSYGPVSQITFNPKRVWEIIRGAFEKNEHQSFNILKVTNRLDMCNNFLKKILDKQKITLKLYGSFLT
jgi:hypothetical protein